MASHQKLGYKGYNLGNYHCKVFPEFFVFSFAFVLQPAQIRSRAAQIKIIIFSPKIQKGKNPSIPILHIYNLTDQHPLHPRKVALTRR